MNIHAHASSFTVSERDIYEIFRRHLEGYVDKSVSDIRVSQFVDEDGIDAFLIDVVVSDDHPSVVDGDQAHEAAVEAYSLLSGNGDSRFPYVRFVVDASASGAEAA